MSKIIFLVIFLISLVSASSDSNIKKSDYNIALQAYNNQNYTLSYKLFHELFYKDLENINVNFYLGKSLFELKKYNEAISAYERILIKQDSSRVTFEIARCYLKQKNYLEARDTFLTLKNGIVSIELSNAIDKYLEEINSKLEKNSINGLVIFGISYDSNLKNRANNDYFTINGLDLNNTTQDEEAYSHQEVAIFNHKYKYSVQALVKNDIMIYNKSIHNNKDNNIQLFSYSPSLVFTHNRKLNTEYKFLFNKLMYGNKSYLNSFGLKPSLKYKFANDIYIKTFIEYQKKKNLIDDNRDSKYYKFDFEVNKILTSTFTFSPSFGLEKEKKENSTLTNIDFESRYLRVASNYQITNKSTINLKLLYKKKNYEDINLTYSKKEKKEEYSLNLSNSYILDMGLVLQSMITYSDIKSNFVSSEYKKSTISINCIKLF